MNNQYLFNVRYYDGLYDNKSFVEEVNRKLLSFKLDKGANDSVMGAIPNRHYFYMKTVYPGLLIGTGNPHSSGDSSDEIKLGFTLDYVSGLPYIPGSTVKGVLRSVFRCKEPDKEKNEDDAHFNARKEAHGGRMKYIKSLIKNVCNQDVEIVDDMLIKLETEIFEYADIFFDVYPVWGGADNRLFAFESITPHKDPLKDPIPLRLLKVIPDVVFEFNFSIKDSGVIPALTAEKKKQLFIEIITDFGMGAKTNVGFGVMEKVYWESPQGAPINGNLSKP